MKSHRQRRPVPAGPSPPIWLFRLVASILVPLAALALVEAALRLCGFGCPTSYFRSCRIDGADYFVPNDLFACQFFPPSLARTPLPLRMEANKPAGTFRIFLFGESAAEGDPDPTFGMGRYLETLLRARFPKTRFEVICVAMPAIDSHVILPIARECAKHDGDLWILCMGNNEMIGPFGPATAFGSQPPTLWLTRCGIALHRFRLGQLVSNCLASRRGPQIWAGMKMFEQNKLPPHDARRLRAYQDFRSNLRDILNAAESARVPTVLCTVASNLRDCAPFMSARRPDLTDSARSQWEQCIASGIAAESASNFAAATPFYEKAATIDPDFANVHYHIGLRDLASGNLAGASNQLTAARDTDVLPFRADSRINEIIRDEAALRAARVTLFDTCAWLARTSPYGLPGNELFYEHVHLNFAGNDAVARGLAETVAPLLPAAAKAGDTRDWLTSESCDAALAVTVWDQFRVWQENYSRVSEPPFTGQLNAQSRARFYKEKLRQLQSQMTPATREAALGAYTNALRQSPDDWFLHGNFAQVLEYIGDLNGAVSERRRVHQLLPYAPEPLYHVGRLQERLGRTSEATAALEEACQLEPLFVPAWVELGEIAANEGRDDEAARLLERALKENPGDIEALVALGFMAQNQGRLEAAQSFYARAAALQPTGPPAHFANAVAASVNHNSDEAIGHFRDAVWMNPQFWQAHYLFGVELTAAGQLAQAREHFAAAAALRPDFAPARQASEKTLP